MIRREGIQTVVINTSPNAPLSPELAFFDEPLTTGSWTTGMIATLTNGMHYELRLRSADKEKAVAEISSILLQTQERFSFRHRLLRGKEN